MVESFAEFVAGFSANIAAPANEMVHHFAVPKSEPNGRTAAETVRLHLLAEVARGTYEPGAKLPTERALVSTLNVSRSAVRNALAVLEAEGRIVRRIGSGTYLPSRSPMPSPEAFLAALAHTSPAELVEARLVLEPQLPMLIVARGTEADFERMETCIAHMEAAATFETYEMWDIALHETIAASTHNALLSSVFATISTQRRQAQWGKLQPHNGSPKRRDDYNVQHRAIVNALKERDAIAASTAMRAHVLTVRRNLFGWESGEVS